MPDNITTNLPQSQFSPSQIHAIAVAVEALVDLLDELGGNPDAEDDDPAELDDEDRAAWIERTDQSRFPLPTRASADFRNCEDAEEDDGGGGGVLTEDEPAFDAQSRAVANLYGADGPGGGSLLDPDCGREGV